MGPLGQVDCYGRTEDLLDPAHAVIDHVREVRCEALEPRAGAIPKIDGVVSLVVPDLAYPAQVAIAVVDEAMRAAGGRVVPGVAPLFRDQVDDIRTGRALLWHLGASGVHKTLPRGSCRYNKADALLFEAFASLGSKERP